MLYDLLCFSCSLPDLNLKHKLITNQLHILFTCEIITATGRQAQL